MSANAWHRRRQKKHMLIAYHRIRKNPAAVEIFTWDGKDYAFVGAEHPYFTYLMLANEIMELLNDADT